MNLLDIISIDPGKTVGWSITRLNVDDNTAVLIRSEQDEDYTFSQALKDAIEHRGFDDLVVIERPPERGNDYKLLNLYGEMLAFVHSTGLSTFKPPYTPLPGLWKPWVAQFAPEAKRLIKASKRHARDSAMIAVYVIKTKKYNRNGGS